MLDRTKTRIAKAGRLGCAEPEWRGLCEALDYLVVFWTVPRQIGLAVWCILNRPLERTLNNVGALWNLLMSTGTYWGSLDHSDLCYGRQDCLGTF